MIGRVKEQLAKLVASQFGRNAGGLTIFAAIGQVVNFCSLLFMDQFYSQDAIGTYSVFVSYSAMLLVVNLLSYQWSIPNAEEGSRLRALIALLLTLTFGSALIAWAGFSLFGYAFATAVGVFTIGKSLILIAEQVNIRRQKYAPINISRVGFPVLLCLFVWLLPLMQMTPDSGTLILAHTAAVGIVGVCYAAYTLREFLTRAEGDAPIRLSLMLQVARDEKKFSLLVMPSQVFNVAAYQLPTILLEKYLGPSIAAQYAVTLRFANLPIGVIGGALSQVYHGKLARTVREGLSDGYSTFRNLNKALIGLGVVVLLGSVFVTPFAIELVLGEEWSLAGDMVRAMSPLYALMLIVSTFSCAFYVFEEQLFLFFNQLAYLIISLVAFGLAIYLGDLMLGVWTFTGLSIVRYLVIYAKLFRVHRLNLD